MFPCEKCGSCCREVGCKYLDKEKNLCTIYSERPLICRVDEFYEKYLYKEISQEEYYKLNKKVCAQLQAKNLL